MRVLTQVAGKDTFGSDRTGAETNVGRRELTRLPTISRSASDFTRLEPSSSNGLLEVETINLITSL